MSRTLKQAIIEADAIKPNAFSNDTKTAWINSVEGRVQLNVWLRAPCEIERYTYADDQDTELLVEPPHDDLYVTFLTAQIDFANGEYEKYRNTMQLYNEQYGDYLRWFTDNYSPAEGYSEAARRAANDNENTPYYVTAYGIAVKNGFIGTENDWLKTLRAESGNLPQNERTGAAVSVELAAGESVRAWNGGAGVTSLTITGFGIPQAGYDTEYRIDVLFGDSASLTLPDGVTVKWSPSAPTFAANTHYRISFWRTPEGDVYKGVWI